MGWFSSSQNLSGQERGRSAFKAFHNYAVSNFPENYQLKNVDELITAAKNGRAGLDLATYVGDLANSLEISETQANEAMENLAKKGEGRIPKNWQDWGNALSNKVMDYSFFDAVTYTAIESTKDIAGGVAQVGDSAIFTLKVMKYLVPALIIGGVAWIGYSRIRQTAGA
jgi:hypothetical protein